MVRNPLGESGAKGSPFALVGKHLAVAAPVSGQKRRRPIVLIRPSRAEFSQSDGGGLSFGPESWESVVSGDFDGPNAPHNFSAKAS